MNHIDTFYNESLCVMLCCSVFLGVAERVLFYSNEHGGKSYILYSHGRSTTLEDAVRHCLNIGMHLATIKERRSSLKSQLEQYLVNNRRKQQVNCTSKIIIYSKHTHIHTLHQYNFVLYMFSVYFLAS